MKGQTFSGDKPTIGGELSSVITPLNYDAYKEASKDPNSANKLLIMLAATLGISTATYDQGQSKPGITGVKAQIVESLNKGDRVGAQKLIDGNFVEKDRKAAMTTAEKSASNYNDPSSDMHVNFYKAYNPLATQRSATEKKVKELTVAGNLGDAHKLVVQYNASIAAALKPFTDKYGQGDAKTAKIIKSARLK